MRSKCLALLILSLSVTDGMAYCFEPSAPSCASGYGAFNDEWDFNQCKRSMESYRDEVESYAECLNRDARSKIEDASSDYSDAVDDFNNRARQ